MARSLVLTEEVPPSYRLATKKRVHFRPLKDSWQYPQPTSGKLFPCAVVTLRNGRIIFRRNEAPATYIPTKRTASLRSHGNLDFFTASLQRDAPVFLSLFFDYVRQSSRDLPRNKKNSLASSVLLFRLIRIPGSARLWRQLCRAVEV